MFYPTKGSSVAAYINYAIFREIGSASTMSSIKVSTTHTVLRPVLGPHDLLLSILRKHVANSIVGYFVAACGGPIYSILRLENNNINKKIYYKI